MGVCLMIKGLYTAAGGMLPRIVEQEAASTNLANSATNGFKKTDVFLRKLIDASSALDRAMGRERQNGPEYLRTDYTQGTFDATGLPLDLALNGPGFFKVGDAAGTVYYTRGGRYILTPEGRVVSSSGMLLLDSQGKPITITGQSVAITGDGTVEVDGEVTATLGVADFDPNGYLGLENVGMGLFRKPAAVNENAKNSGTNVLQGYLEDSNADTIRLMVDMIEISRTFEMGQKSIQIQDQTLQRVVTELGAVR